LRIAASATVTIEMSADPELAGRPLEAADGERALRELTRRVRRDVEHEEMRHPIVLLDDLELAVLLVAILQLRGLRIGHGVGDALAVRRPREAADAVLERRERFGFTTARIDHIDLPFVGAIRDECQARSVRRPGRRLARFFRVRQRVRLSRLDIGNPDFGFVRVVVPVRVAQRVSDEAAIRRDLWRGHAFQRQNLVDRRRHGRLRDQHL
jgi:hypothetical protein